MKTKRLICLLMTLALCLSLLPTAAFATGETGWAADIPAMLAAGPYAEGEVIVGVDPAYADGFDLLTLMGLREDLEGEDLMTVPAEETASGEAVLTFLSRPDKTTEELLYALAGDSRVVFAEPNYRFETPESASEGGMAVALGQAAEAVSREGGVSLQGESDADRWDGVASHDQIADLTDFQWGHKAVHTPSFGTGTGNMTGEPIVVAVIDCPVDFSHPDLAPVAFTFTEEQQEALSCDEHGFNALSEDGKLELEGANSHGTHVAGIIGAAWDGNGVSGVASNVRIVSIQIVDTEGRTSLVHGLRAYDFIRRANALGADIRIANNSWALLQSSLALDAAVRALGEKQGVISVFAAGNAGRDLRDYGNETASLAGNPYAILAAASDPAEELTSFSSYSGDMVTLAAPGAGILSTVMPEHGIFAPWIAPDSARFLENFEEEVPRVTMVQNGTDMENASAVTEDWALTGGHALALRLDLKEEEADPYLDFSLDLTFHGIEPDREVGNYLGMRFNGSGLVGLYSSQWLGIEEEPASPLSMGYTDDDYLIPCCLEVPREAALGEGPADLTLRLWFSVDPDVDTIYFDDIGMGDEKAPYQYLSGTSQACPLVAGAAAVLAAQTGKRGAELAELVKTKVRQTEGLMDKVISGGVFDFDSPGTASLRQGTDPSCPLYDAALPLDMSTGENPFAFDAQGDWETRGPLAGLDGRLYYLPTVTQVEEESGCKPFLAFDPGTKTWETLPELPRWLDQVSAAAFDGKLAVKGIAMSVDPATGVPSRDEGGEACVYIYDPETKGWSPASVEGVLPGQTLFATGGGWALTGSDRMDPDTEEIPPAVLADYDPFAGASSERSLTAGLEYPQVAERGGTVYLFCASDYSLVKVTKDGEEDLTDALPDYRAMHIDPDDYHSYNERTERDGVLLATDEGLLLVGVLSEDAAADTWLLREGAEKFEPLLRKTCLTRPFYVTAEVFNGKVYAIGTVWNEDTPRFFRANDLATLNERIPAPTGDVSDRFVDVSRDAWYHDAVQWAVDKGLMNGVSDTLFAPNETCTRAMVVTMLWRLAGEPASSAPAPFTDVISDAWYTQAVAWAAETGAVNGTSADTFSPNTPVTREQLAAILYRYAQAQGKGFTGAWMFLLDYPDRDQVSDWANEAMHWMTMHGVITGMGDGTLAPKDNATRAQIATMFMRFCAEMGE